MKSSMQAKRIVSTIKPERSLQAKKEGRAAFVKKQQGGLVKKEGFKKEGALRAVTKSKKPSKIATGRLKYFLVFSGRRQKTSGGLTKECIGINKRGRYVSLKRAENGANIYGNTIQPWNRAFTKARRQLNCAGFVAINGRTLMGQALYIRMKKLHVQVEEAKKEEAKAEQISETMEVAHGMADAVASTTPAVMTTVPDSDVEPVVCETGVMTAVGDQAAV